MFASYLHVPPLMHKHGGIVVVVIVVVVVVVVVGAFLNKTVKYFSKKYFIKERFFRWLYSIKIMLWSISTKKIRIRKRCAILLL